MGERASELARGDRVSRRGTRSAPPLPLPLIAIALSCSADCLPVGAPPAVINAIVDALNRRAGVRHIDMPATARRVWEMINSVH